jgi:hypothetical protein
MGGIVKTFAALHKKRWIRRMRELFGDHMPRDFEKLKEKSEMLRITYMDGPPGFGATLILTEKEVDEMMKTRQFTRQFWQPVSMLQTLPWMDGTYLSYHYSYVGAEQRKDDLGARLAADIEPTRSGPPYSEVLLYDRKETKWEYGDEDLFESDEIDVCRTLNLPETFSALRAETRVSEVPQKIRAHLMERYWDLRKATFEFIRDGHDGLLWLVNASRVRCEKSGPQPVIIDPVRAEEERLAKMVRYFREEPFAKTIEDHDKYLSRYGELDEVVERKERVDKALQKFRTLAGGLGSEMSAEIHAVMHVPQRIIPVFTGTDKKALSAWFQDTELVEKPDPLAEVMKPLLGVAPPESETQEIPKSDNFVAQPLDFTMGRVAKRDKSIITYSSEVVYPVRTRAASIVERSGIERANTLATIGCRTGSPTKKKELDLSRMSTPSLPSSPSRNRMSATGSTFFGSSSTMERSMSRPTTHTSSRSLLRTASAVF